MTDVLTGPWDAASREPPGTFDLVRIVAKLVEYLHSLPDDYDPMDPEHDRMQDWLDAIEADLPEKLRALHAFAERMGSEEAFLAEQEKRLTKKRRQAQRLKKRASMAAIELMEIHLGLSGERTVVTPDLRVTLYETAGRVELSPLLVDIPEEWGDQKWTPNKTRIKDALKAGKEVPGAKLVKSNAVRWS